jgi:hypothetical protein
MPTYLYALIGALVFAIAHGMHFTVSPLPAGVERDVVQIAGAPVAGEERSKLWDHTDIRIAGIGY